MKTSPAFTKPDTRGTAKSVRMNELQRQILDRVSEIEGCTQTDVILRGLDMYACGLLRRTNDRKLRKLLSSM
jgi:hypothetical protein